LSGRASGRWSSAPPPSSASARRRPPVGRGTTAGLPDVRDGLTRLERVVLWQLHELQREYPKKGVPTAALYGRVVEHVNVSEPEFMRVLQRLVGTKT
jgi:hypothetical protein